MTRRLGGEGESVWVNYREHPLVLFKNFRYLFAARLISAIGDKFFTIALAWYVISQGTVDSKIQLGLLMAVNMLPVALFGPFSGAWVDRLDKKHCMMAADLARAVFAMLLFVLLTFNLLHMVWLYVLCFGIAAFIPLFEAASNTLVARLTDDEHLQQAVAVDTTAVHLSAVLGALAGSMMLVSVGTAGAFLVNGLSFLVSFVLVWKIRISSSTGEIQSSGKVFHGLREGFAFVLSNRPLLYLLLLFGAFNFFSAPVLLLIPLLVKFVLQADVTWVAIFEACLATGSLALAVVLSIKQSRGYLYEKIFGCLLCMGLAIVAMGCSQQQLVLGGLLCLTGAVLAVVDTLAMVLFQRIVPDQMKGRFFSIVITIATLVLPASFICNAIQSQWLSVPQMLWLNGGACMILSLLVLMIPKSNMIAGD